MTTQPQPFTRAPLSTRFIPMESKRLYAPPTVHDERQIAYLRSLGHGGVVLDMQRDSYAVQRDILSKAPAGKAIKFAAGKLGRANLVTAWMIAGRGAAETRKEANIPEAVDPVSLERLTVDGLRAGILQKLQIAPGLMGRVTPRLTPDQVPTDDDRRVGRFFAGLAHDLFLLERQAIPAGTPHGASKAVREICLDGHQATHEDADRIGVFSSNAQYVDPYSPEFIDWHDNAPGSAWFALQAAQQNVAAVRQARLVQ